MMKLTTLCCTTCLCLSSFFVGTALEAFPKPSLTAPYLSRDAVVKASVSIHDFRDKGIRVEPSYMRDKLIIHNYGHGGASLPLSWGSVEEAFEYLEIELLSDEFAYDFGEVAVLGAGILGLTTANFFLDRGYKVHVYSEAFAPHITNDHLEGLWWPTAVSMGDGWLAKRAFKRILHHSFKHFKKLAESPNPEFAGVTPRTVYAFSEQCSPLDEAIEELLEVEAYVSVTFDTGAHHRGICYETFHIDPQLYTRSLYEKALAKGAIFVRRSFHSKEELEDLDENIIFNCTGKGSKALFEDDELSTVRHQVLELSPQKDVDYMLRAQSHDGNRTHILSFGDHLIIGGDYQFSDNNTLVDPFEMIRTLDRANAFFH